MGVDCGYGPCWGACPALHCTERSCQIPQPVLCLPPYHRAPPRCLAPRRTKLRADFRGVQARGWRVWPLASYLNQEFVPLKLRVLWLNVVALGWTTFLITQGRTLGAPALRRKLGGA